MISIPLEIVISGNIFILSINIIGYFFLRKTRKELPENKYIKISSEFFFIGILFQIIFITLDIVYYFGIVSLLKA